MSPLGRPQPPPNPTPFPPLRLSAILDPEAHFVIPVTLSTDSKTISTHALIDLGANSLFIDDRFVAQHHLPRIQKPIPRPLHVINGRPILSGAVTHSVSMALRISSHHESSSFDICRIGHYPVVLGIPWLRQHNPTIDWPFHSALCNRSCLPIPSMLPALPLVPFYCHEPVSGVRPAICSCLG